MKAFILIIAIGFSGIIFGQKGPKISKADQLFSQSKYMSASPYYEYHLKKMKRKNKWDFGVHRAVITFYKTGNYEKALEGATYSFNHGHKEQDVMFIMYDCAKRLGKEEVCKMMMDDYVIKKMVLTDMQTGTYEITKLTKKGKIEYGGLANYVSADEDYFWIVGKEEYRGHQYSVLIDSSGASNYNKKFYNAQLTYNNGIYYFTQSKKEKILSDKAMVGIYEGVDPNNLKPFNYNSSNYNVGHPTFTKDGVMYFASDRKGGFGGVDIWRTTKVNGEWTEPVNMKELNTEYDDNWPFYDEQTNQLYFSSNGRYGNGGLDIYAYSFKSGKVRSINGLNSKGDDFCVYRVDELVLGFSSDRTGDDARYLAKGTKSTNKIQIVALNGLGENIGGMDKCEIYITNLSTGGSEKLTWEDGYYVGEVKENVDYVITGTAENHTLDKTLKFNSGQFNDAEPLKMNLVFTEIEYDLLVKTIANVSRLSIPGTKVTFTNLADRSEIVVVTDERGEKLVKVQLEGDYAVFAQKKGFLDYHSRIYADKYELIELDMELIEIKKDVIFKIENILYDLNSSALRDSSKIELTKLAEFLKINDNIKVELGSHTDSRSSDKYNQTLSQKRAQSCVDFLVAYGIDRERIIAKGYGERNLLNRCKDGVDCSEQEHQLNRRTEVKILSID